MASKTINESKATHYAAWEGDNKESKVSNSSVKNRIVVKGLNGQAYLVDITYLQKIQLKAAPTNFAGIMDSANNTTNYFEY